MKTPSPSPKRLPGGIAARAFTLVELLVVVSIVLLLLGMLVPSVSKGIAMTRRRACAANQRAIVNAASLYVLADDRHNLPTVFHKTKNPGYSNWANMGDKPKVLGGQPACLWLLVSERKVDRTAFLCPEATGNRRWAAPPDDANHFTYDATADKSTLSYSFISMTYHVGSGGWTDPTTNLPAVQLADQMSMDQVPGTLVVLADQNPRCTFGSQTLKTYAEISAANPGLTNKTRRNSTNHNREGQNITRLDGSANWVKDPNDQSKNDVYTSSTPNTAQEKEGRRKDMADPFVLP